MTSDTNISVTADYPQRHISQVLHPQPIIYCRKAANYIYGNIAIVMPSVHVSYYI